MRSDAILLVVVPQGIKDLHSCIDRIRGHYEIAIAGRDAELVAMMRMQGYSCFTLAHSYLKSWLYLALLIARLRPHRIVVIQDAGASRSNIVGEVRSVVRTLNACIPTFVQTQDALLLVMNQKQERSHRIFTVYVSCLVIGVGALQLVWGWIVWPAAAALYIGLQRGLATIAQRRKRHSEHEAGQQVLPQCQKTIEYSSPNPLYTYEHSYLGWTHSAHIDMTQKFATSEPRREYSCHIRTDGQGHRLTADHSVSVNSAVTMAVLGCSYTFGAGLSDDKTYPWLLQAKLTNWEITNYGCCGYSLYQMLLVLESILETEHPQLVVLGFHAALENRLAWSMQDLSDMFADGRKFPSCLISEKRLYKYPPIGYRRIPLSEYDLALKSIEKAMNYVRLKRLLRSGMLRKTNEHLLLQMRNLTQAKGARFVVICLDASSSYYEFFFSNNFTWLVSPVRLLQDPAKITWTLHPFDTHPNQKANQVWAEILAKTLPEILNGGTITPRIEELGPWPSEENDKRTTQTYPLF